MVDHFMKIDGATPHFITKLSERIRANKAYDNDTKEMMVRELVDSHLASMPERNPLKANMFADLSAGSSKDLIDAFAKRQTMANNALISAQASSRMAEAFTSINNVDEATMRETPGWSSTAVELASYEKQMKERVADLQQSVNTPVVDGLRALAAPWRLGLSAAYMLTNSYQPFQMTLQQLGGHVRLRALDGRDGTCVRQGVPRRATGSSRASGTGARARTCGAVRWTRPRLESSSARSRTPTARSCSTGTSWICSITCRPRASCQFGNVQQMWRPQSVHGTEIDDEQAAGGEPRRERASALHRAGEPSSGRAHRARAGDDATSALAAAIEHPTKGAARLREEVRSHDDPRHGR
jgi:hypothetical protein